MATTYEKIATTILGSAQASITFSSIPATYTDLRLVIVGTSSGNANPELTFNGDNSGAGTNYSRTALAGNGSSAVSTQDTNLPYIVNYLVFFTSGTVSYQSFDIFSYAGSTFKTVLCDGAADRNGSGATGKAVGLWRSTSAITSLRLFFASQTFSTGTTATLYGIKAA
jgi:hypothetical protein